MFQATLQTTITAPWTDMAPVRVGEVPIGLGTPDVSVLAQRDGEPFLRIDVYASSGECFAFQEAIAWRDWIVIGFGNGVYLIEPYSQQVCAYLLEGYFGHLYAAEDFLLIASAARLLCISTEGTLRWRSDSLGIDGVIVDSVESGFIFGEGEWDPPEGWKPFQIDALNGKVARV